MDFGSLSQLLVLSRDNVGARATAERLAVSLRVSAKSYPARAVCDLIASVNLLLNVQGNAHDPFARRPSILGAEARIMPPVANQRVTANLDIWRAA